MYVHKFSSLSSFSVFLALSCTVLERSIALANRSATLFHMQKHSECLVDIRRALELQYPKDLIYKLYERQASCYMALKDYPRTIAAFK